MCNVIIAACIWISVYVRMYVCVCVCMYICMYICMYVTIKITFIFKPDIHLVSLVTNVLCYVA